MSWWKRAQRAEPGTLEHYAYWGTETFLEAEEERQRRKEDERQLVRIAPYDGTHTGFTPNPEEWDDLLRLLKAATAAPGERRDAELTPQGPGWEEPYEGFTLVDPEDRSRREVEAHSLAAPAEVPAPRDVYYVCRGWVVEHGKRAERRWWPDTDGALEGHLLALACRYGLRDELARRRAPLSSL